MRGLSIFCRVSIKKHAEAVEAVDALMHNLIISHKYSYCSVVLTMAYCTSFVFCFRMFLAIYAVAKMLTRQNHNAFYVYLADGTLRNAVFRR